MQIVTYLKKLDHTETTDFDKLPETSQKYLIEYGLKQCLNDSMAGAQDKAEAEARFLARLDKLQNGTMGLIRTRTSVDPITAEATKLARALLRQKFGKSIDKDTLKAKSIELAQDERLQAKAKAIIEARNGLAAIEVELDLG